MVHMTLFFFSLNNWKRGEQAMLVVDDVHFLDLHSLEFLMKLGQSPRRMYLQSLSPSPSPHLCIAAVYCANSRRHRSGLFGYMCSQGICSTATGYLLLTVYCCTCSTHSKLLLHLLQATPHWHSAYQEVLFEPGGFKLAGGL